MESERVDDHHPSTLIVSQLVIHPTNVETQKTISKVYQTEESQGTQSTWSFSLAGIISKALISQCLEHLTKFYMETVKLQTLLRPASTSLVLVPAHCWLCKP